MEPIVYKIKDSSRTYWKITLVNTGFTQDEGGTGEEDFLWDVALSTDDPCARFQFNLSARMCGNWDMTPTVEDVLYHFSGFVSYAMIDLMNCKPKFTNI